MRRNHPDVEELEGPTALPAPAATIVEILGPLVTPARLDRMRAVAARRTRSLVPVLEDVADPHNGAAVLRSADAFGCHEVHLVMPKRPFAVSHRITRGTHRWLERIHHPTTEACLEHLGARGYPVFVAAMDGKLTPEDLARVPKAAVVFGNEHKGASAAVRAAAAGTYAIPMVGFVESLNVSVASAITLYVASRGRQGDLDEDARTEVVARFLLTSVREAERVLRERLGA
jgi:tRNA (guanosine-2'-O-)-methyltransferase